jgi:hypothetical protein
MRFKLKSIPFPIQIALTLGGSSLALTGAFAGLSALGADWVNGANNLPDRDLPWLVTIVGAVMVAIVTLLRRVRTPEPPVSEADRPSAPLPGGPHA